MSPDPTRIYVSTRSYTSPATQEHLTPGGVVNPGMKLRGDHPVVIERPDAWIDVANDPSTVALAQALAGVPVPSAPDTDDEDLEDGPAPARGTGLTRQDVLRSRRQWQEEGGKPPWKRAGVSESTYIRHRHRFGLVPWPKGYRNRLTP